MPTPIPRATDDPRSPVTKHWHLQAPDLSIGAGNAGGWGGPTALRLQTGSGHGRRIIQSRVNLMVVLVRYSPADAANASPYHGRRGRQGVCCVGGAIAAISSAARSKASPGGGGWSPLSFCALLSSV